MKDPLFINFLKKGSKSICSILLLVFAFLTLLYVRHFLAEMAEKEAAHLRTEAQKIILMNEFCNSELTTERQRAERANHDDCVAAKSYLSTSAQSKAFFDTLYTEYKHVPFISWCVESKWCLGFVVYQVVDLIKITWWAFISTTSLVLFSAIVVYKYFYPSLRSMYLSFKSMEDKHIRSQALEGLPTKNE